jgi:hypothetical protein
MFSASDSLRHNLRISTRLRVILRRPAGVMRLRSSLLSVLVFAWTTSVAAQDFAFVAGNPTQCDEMNITWQGGLPPYIVTLTPPHGTAINATLPGNSTQGSSGVPIPFVKGQTLLVTLSDSTGFATGGTSQLLTVGSSQSGVNCNTTNPGVDFIFELNSPLVQCQPYPISGYAGAVQPVTIFGLIPGGQSFVLNPPVSNENSFDWTANVKAGTSVVLSMVDAIGRIGGTSDVLIVGNSSNSSCLLNAPSSTPALTASSTPPPPSSSPPSTGTTTPVQGASQKPKSGLPLGAVAGITGGAAFIVSILILISLFICKKPKNGSNDFFLINRKPRAINTEEQSDFVTVDLPPSQYAPRPFVMPPASPYVRPPAPAPISPPGLHSHNASMASAYTYTHTSANAAFPRSLPTSFGTTLITSDDPNRNVTSNRYSTEDPFLKADPYSAYTGLTRSEVAFIPNHPYATAKSSSSYSPPQESRLALPTDISESEHAVEYPPRHPQRRHEKFTTSILSPRRT